MRHGPTGETVRDRAAAAASTGSRTLREERAEDPVSTSPVPAVARRPARVRRSRCARRVSARSCRRPWQDDGAEALGAFARSLESVSTHPVRVASEEPRELAACGSGRVARRVDRLEPKTRRRRRRRAARRGAEARARADAPRRSAPAGPDRDRLARSISVASVSRTSCHSNRASPARGRASRPRRGTRRRHASVTYPASARIAARALRTGADVVPGEPPTTSSAPVVNFESPSCFRGTRASSAGSARTACAGDDSSPMSATTTSPA